jgi:hypothetical protein
MIQSFPCAESGPRAGRANQPIDQLERLREIVPSRGFLAKCQRDIASTNRQRA